MIDRVIDNRGIDSFDIRFIGLIGAILAFGVVSIYSVTHMQDGGVPLYLKQVVWILFESIAFFVMLVSDYHKVARLAILRSCDPAALGGCAHDGKNLSRGAAVDDDRAICLSTVGVRQTGSYSGPRELLLLGSSNRMDATRGHSWSVGLAGAALNPETA